MTQKDKELAEKIADKYIENALINNKDVFALEYTDAIEAMEAYHEAKLVEKTDESNKIEAELRSLKQTIIESKLHDFFPERDMPFHDKMILAIGKMAEIYEITDEDIRGWAHKLPETYKSINSKGEDVSMFKTKNIAIRAAFIACAIIGAKALRNGEIKHQDK